MNKLILLASVTLLSGCMFGTSNEIKKAEKLLSHFQCNNIESAHMAHSSINRPLAKVVIASSSGLPVQRLS